MIRHISIFTLQDGPEKEAHLKALRALLESIPAEYPAIVRQTVAAPAAPVPSLPDEAPVMFGDLIQTADFASPEDAAGYPASAAHIGLSEKTTPWMKKVTTIDYEIAEGLE